MNAKSTVVRAAGPSNLWTSFARTIITVATHLRALAGLTDS
jgi:hypothetical protein